MTYKLFFIAAAAMAFAWSFSSLVEHRDGRPVPQQDNTKIACSGWQGNGCTRPNIR